MALKPAFLIATLLWASAVAAHSKIYTYLDADGQRHYTDVPDNNRYRLLVLSPNDRTASGDRYDSALLAKASRYDSIIEKAAISASVEPNLLRAVIVVESGFNSRAVSKRGAMGLMQLMPATARLMAPSGDLEDPGFNIELGTRFLAGLVREFNDPRLALAAYNAGPNRVRQWLNTWRSDDIEAFVEQIPFDETRLYVKKVVLSWDEYRRIYGSP